MGLVDHTKHKFHWRKNGIICRRYYYIHRILIYWLCLWTSHVEHTCVAASFHKEGMIWTIKQAKPCHFIVICLYQARKLSMYLFVRGVDLFLSTFFCLFWKCSILWFSFYFNNMSCLSIWLVNDTGIPELKPLISNKTITVITTNKNGFLK
jgi:hypothetical protein